MMDREDADSQRTDRDSNTDRASRDDGALEYSFNSTEAFQRLLSRYNGSVELAAQAIGVEQKTLQAWMDDMSRRQSHKQPGIELDHEV